MLVIFFPETACNPWEFWDHASKTRTGATALITHHSPHQVPILSGRKTENMGVVAVYSYTPLTELADTRPPSSATTLSS